MVGWSTLFCKYRIFSLNLLWLVSFDVHHSICNAMLLFLGLVLLHNDIPRPCWIIASSSILHQFFIIIIIIIKHILMGLSHVLTTVMASSTFRISICNNSPWFLGYPTGRLRRWKNLPPPFPPSFGLVPVPPVPRKRPDGKDGKVSHGGYMMLTWCIEIEKNDQRTANNWINDLSKFSNSSTLCEYRNKKKHINHG